MPTKSSQSYINQYLENNTGVSATELCQHLIEHQGFSRETYSTGRPKLYVDVVKYLEKLQRSGHLQAIEKNQDDCRYEVLSNGISEELINENTVTEKDNSKKEDEQENLQMSLF